MKQRYLTPHLFYIVLTVIITSCSTAKDYKDYNYYNGTRLYNDTLNLTVKFPGDVRFDQDIKKRKIKREIRALPELKRAKLLTYGKTVIHPYYQLFLFYKPSDNINGFDSISQKNKSKLILKDTINRRVIYKSETDGKILYLVLRGKGELESTRAETTLPDISPKEDFPTEKFSKSMQPVINDGKSIIESAKFDYSKEDILGYWDIFNTYFNESNILFLQNKLENAPVQQNQQSEWDKKQIMLTLLSRDPENKTFLDLSVNPQKIAYIQKLVDEAIHKEDGVFQSRTRALEEIERLAQKEKIVMLNESHWLPRHRIFASQLLAPLKKAGYHYLSVEAVYEEKDKFLNKHKVPLNSTGYYVREPYFGLFLRKAKQLGFTIVSYDRFNTENRELTQAENILKILDDDPQAKIFVYAGFAHINEKTASTKRMAEYLKEISAIDPLTIDQELIEGDTDEDVILFKTETFPEDEKIHKNVDYFLLNNIQPGLKEFFPEMPFIDYSIKIPPLKKYKNQDVFVSVFLSEEYDKYKRNAVSIKNIIYQVNDNYIRLNLPVGTYQLKIQDVENKLVYDKKIEVSIN